MKITYEFDTESEDWKDGTDSMRRDQFEASFGMLKALSDIQDKLREWYKYDTREHIPIEEIRDVLVGIIDENVPNIERLIYG